MFFSRHQTGVAQSAPPPFDVMVQAGDALVTCLHATTILLYIGLILVVFLELRKTRLKVFQRKQDKSASD